MRLVNRMMAFSLAAVAFLPAFAAELDVGDGTNDNTYSDKAAYEGATKIIKTGTGKTTLNFGTYTTNPGFTGEIEVQQGTLAVHGIANLGTPSKITVSDGATLDLTTGETKDPTNLVGKEIVISGSGQNGAGALVRGGSKGVNNLFQTLTLAGDATITLNVQVGLGNGGSSGAYGVVKLNGHTLTKSGTDKLYCPNVRFYGADGTTADPGHIVVASGTLFLRYGYALQGGSANNTITLQAGAELQLRDTAPIAWAINATGTDAKIYSDNTVSDAARNRLCGPVKNTSSFLLSPGATAPISLYGNSLTLENGLKVNGAGPTTFTDVFVTNKAVDGITIENSSVLTRLILDGNTFVTSETNESGRAKTRFLPGQTYMNSDRRMGALEICGNSVVTNFGLAIGRDGWGALYQRGGYSYWLASNASYDRSANTAGSYGYFGLTGGKFIFDGEGPVANEKSSHFGVSGRFVMALHGGSAEFTSSDKVGFAFKGGTFACYQDGGTTNSFDGAFDFGDNSSRNQTSHAFVTVSGTNTRLTAGTYLRSFMTNAGAETFVNINDGGTIATKYIYRLSAQLPFYLNFNGGILRPLLANSSFTYRDEVARYPTAATVYEGGLTIDTTEALNSRGEQADDDYFRIQFPLVAPDAEGKRIAAIALPAAVSSLKLVGSPVVTISGDGEGASAFALFDDVTRTVTNIVVTSPGWGYTEATAKLVDGGLAEEYECEVTLTDQPAAGWAGLTKRGATRVELYGANTFAGDVTVEEGMLSFRNSTAAQNGLPEGAGVAIKNGATLSFAAADTAVTVPFLAGCGSTSFGYFTVTNRIECTAEDIFAGRHLRIGRNITLADGVKIVVTDPENLAAYRNRGRAVVLEGGTDAANYTLVCAGRLELDFGSESGAENVSRWSLRVADKRLTLGYVKGLQISVQ